MFDAPRTSTVVRVGGDPRDVSAVRSLLEAASALDEVVVVHDRSCDDLGTLLSAQAGRVRAVVVPADASDAVARHAGTAVAAGASVEFVDLSGSDSGRDREPAVLSVVVWCGSSTADVVDTVAGLVTDAAARPEWDVELVLVTSSQDVVRPVVDAVDGELVVVVDPTGDPAAAFAAGRARATGTHVVEVLAGGAVAWDVVHLLAPVPDPPAPRSSGPARPGDDRSVATAPVQRTLVSVVLVTADDADELAGCLLSIADAGEGLRADAEFVVVDDASTDGTPDLLRGLEGEVTVVRNHRRIGTTRCLRRARACADGEHVVLLDPRARVGAGWLDALLDALRPGDGAGPVPVWVLDENGALEAPTGDPVLSGR